MDELSAQAYDENELDQVIDHQTKKPAQIFAHEPRIG